MILHAIYIWLFMEMQWRKSLFENIVNLTSQIKLRKKKSEYIMCCVLSNPGTLRLGEGYTLLTEYTLSTPGCLADTLASYETRSSKRTQTPPRLCFDLLVWPWPVVKVKKTDVIRCRFLYCTLVPGMMSMGLMFYEISPFVFLMWPLTFTCDLQFLSRSLAL